MQAMKHRRLRVPWTALLALLFAACGPGRTPTPAVLPTDTDLPQPITTLPPGGTPTVPSSAPPTEGTPEQPPGGVPTTTPLPPLPGQIAYYVDDYPSSSLWLVNADGSDPHVLLINESFAYITRISWSPDLTLLAYASSRNEDIIIVNANGSGAHNITNTNEYAEIDPAWSPDGQKIAFSSNRAGGTNRNNYDIFTMSVDGDNIVKLTECSGKCAFPSWSPDGQSLVYACDSDICLMKSSGADPVNLTRGVGLNTRPAWSPDGLHIAFLRGVTYPRFLYWMNPDGTSLAPLTGDNDRLSFFTWSPDGRYIAYNNNPFAGTQGTYILDLESSRSRFFMADLGSPAWSPGPQDSGMNPEATETVPDCTSGWTRLVVGGQGRVLGSPGDPPNRVRSEPVKAENTIAQLQPGTIFQVVAGPVCADGLVFWQVASDSIPGNTGWTAEGDGTEYWLEPYVP